MMPKNKGTTRTPISERLAKWRNKKEETSTSAVKPGEISNPSKKKLSRMPLHVREQSKKPTALQKHDMKENAVLEKKRKASNNDAGSPTVQIGNPLKKRRLTESSVPRNIKPMGLSQRMQQSHLKAIERMKKREQVNKNKPHVTTGILASTRKPKQLCPAKDINSTLQILFSTPTHKESSRHRGIVTEQKIKKAVEQQASKAKDFAVQTNQVSTMSQSKKSSLQSGKDMNSTLKLLFSTPDCKEERTAKKKPEKNQPSKTSTQDKLIERLQKWRQNKDEEGEKKNAPICPPPARKTLPNRKSLAPNPTANASKKMVPERTPGKSILSKNVVHLSRKSEAFKGTKVTERPQSVQKSKVTNITASKNTRKSLAPNMKLNIVAASTSCKSARSSRKLLSPEKCKDRQSMKPTQSRPSRRATMGSTTAKQETPIKVRLERWRKKKEESKFAEQERRKTLPPFISCGASVKKTIQENSGISQLKTPRKRHLTQPLKNETGTKRTSVDPKVKSVTVKKNTVDEVKPKRLSLSMLHRKKGVVKVTKPITTKPKGRLSIASSNIEACPGGEKPLPNASPIHGKQKTRRSILKPTAIVEPPIAIPEEVAEAPSEEPGSPSLMVMPITPFQNEKQSHVRFAATPSQCASRCNSLPPTPASINFGTDQDLEQQSMREKLDSWLEAHGKTPTRFRHLCCFGDRLDEKKGEIKPVFGGLSSDELFHQQEQLDREESILSLDSVPVSYLDNQDPLQTQLSHLLQECMLLFEAGCTGKDINHWLTEIGENIVGAKQSAQYWICHANIAEEEGDDNLAVDMFETAARNGAKPAEQVAEALKEFVVRMNDRQQAKQLAAHTPRRSHEVQPQNVFTSSAVKYCLTKTTPFFKKLRDNLDCKNTPQAIVTPVRRSTRRSCASLPKMLQDHDELYETLEEMPQVAYRGALFQPNYALTFDEEEDDKETLDSQDMALDFSFGSEDSVFSNDHID